MLDTTDCPSAAEPADLAIVAREKRDVMLTAIRQLPAIERQVVVLHLEGLSYQEIEQVSGLSQSAIATRLSRIRARLTEVVQKKGAR